MPDDTLTAAQAQQLGVHAVDDLLGGVVPYAFVATKAISHPLVDANAQAPDGWQPDLGMALADMTLPGYTAFSAGDARRSFARLHAGGPVRLKLPHGVGGLGQGCLATRRRWTRHWRPCPRTSCASMAWCWNGMCTSRPPSASAKPTAPA